MRKSDFEAFMTDGDGNAGTPDSGKAGAPLLEVGSVNDGNGEWGMDEVSEVY